MKAFDKLAQRMTELEANGGSEPVRVTFHNLTIPDTVTSCGKVQLWLDDTEVPLPDRLVHFEIELGPVNALKLIKFLEKLPDEPEE